MYYFSISPKIAIIICKSNINNIIIPDEETIKQINEDALLSVFQTYSTFLVSSTKNELEKLKEIATSEAFVKKVTLFRLYDKVKDLNAEDLHLLHPNEIEILSFAYKYDQLPSDIADKLKKHGII